MAQLSIDLHVGREIVVVTIPGGKKLLLRLHEARNKRATLHFYGEKEVFNIGRAPITTKPDGLEVIGGEVKEAKS